MKRLALAALALAACAHEPPESRAAAPGDDRAVVVEFWATWCGPCHTFETEYLPDPAVQAALAHVRFVRYDIDSFAGERAFHRLLPRVAAGRVPLFAGVVDDHVVRYLVGLPSTKERLVGFVNSVAELGGSESAITGAIEAPSAAPPALMRAAHWYEARRRRDEASACYARVAASPAASDELRAEADWYAGRWWRKGEPHDPRAPLAFARAHPSTPAGRAALEIVGVVKGLGPDEIAAVFRAWVGAAGRDAGAINDLVYYALAAHQYDLALELAQQAVRARPDAITYDTLAEVSYYRQDAASAVHFAERATALAPSNAELAANLARFRRADGTPCGEVESLRSWGLYWLPRFYGDVD